ncbi:hypothetical protein EJ04DRAFT_524579 [Polyplosphaeria fusca]|uniref:Uncharacterized protein n=1 Tax=Polyplosphaeria fusca TaxID=682080 RepID=A0A9P4QVE0_9PLEO|nr:hypothetical protein EJ04DRAFT_524579 [Polyplosphaeria fusca]
MQTIDNASIFEMLRDNPFSMYSASHRRQVSNPTDRVHGIIQIFGFQLHPRDPKGNIYGLEKLQDMIPENALQKSPVENQFFMHTEPWEPGTEWKLATRSIFLERAKKLT